jgi:hypothetical protein
VQRVLLCHLKLVIVVVAIASEWTYHHAHVFCDIVFNFRLLRLTKARSTTRTVVQIGGRHALAEIIVPFVSAFEIFTLEQRLDAFLQINSLQCRVT